MSVKKAAKNVNVDAESNGQSQSNGKISAHDHESPKPLPTLPQKLKEITTRTVLFDRETAEAWLKRNKSNRPIRPSSVKQFSRLIENGEFRLTSQGISINRRGELQDGQHRLLAIIKHYDDSNGKAKPVPMRVTEGEDDNFAFFDQGVNRTTADVMAAESVEHPKETANAARLLWIRYYGKMVSGAGKVSPYQLNEFLKMFSDFDKSVKFVMNFGSAEDSIPCRELISPGYAIALHYLMCHAAEKDGGTVKDAQAKANTFWTGVIEQDAKEGTQMYNLYRKIKICNSKKDTRLSRDSLVEYCVQAMAKYLDGDKTKLSIKSERTYLGGYDCGGVDDNDVTEDVASNDE